MGKTKSNRDGVAVAASKFKKLKRRREVEVVACPSAFPISEKSRGRKRSPYQERKQKNSIGSSKNSNPLLDWHETTKEIRAYGATAFEGQQKRDYEDEKYFRLTGRHKKKPKVPLPILRGIKKAAAKREKKAREEAREAGIVVAKPQKEVKKSSSTYRTYGPAPNIGFMKNGVFRVQKDKR